MIKERYLRLLIAFMLIAMQYPQRCDAQEKTSWVNNIVEKVNAFLDARTISTDTNYVARPLQPWTLKARYKLASTYFSTEDNYGGDNYKYYFESDYKSSVGMTANYRGLSVSLALNTSHSSGKELNINYYNNKFGIDLGYTDTKHFRGSEDYANLWKSDSHKDDLRDTRLTAYSLNGYYVFNRKKFSFPAAFTHSWIQKRSAGSFLAGLTFYTGKFDVDLNVVTPEDAQRLHYWIDKARMSYVSLNFGYGYNFVLGKHWLLHASAMPGLMLWKDYNADVMTLDVDQQTGKVIFGESKKEHWPKRFWDNTGTIRASVNYMFDRSFIGVSSVYLLERIGSSDDGTVFGLRWKMFAYYGIRL